VPSCSANQRWRGWPLWLRLRWRRLGLRGGLDGGLLSGFGQLADHLAATLDAPWSVRSRGRCSACGSAGGLAVTEDEDCGHILSTHLNGTLTSNIVINTQPTPPTDQNGLFKESFGGFQMWFIKIAFLASRSIWLVGLTDQSLAQCIRLGPDRC